MKLTDTTGVVKYRAEFSPFGQTVMEWSASGDTYLNTKKFATYERDEATGLDYANARMYNNVRGRFMQPDILGLGASDFRRPQTLNRYAYVSNDPINYIDRTGLNEEPADVGHILTIRTEARGPGGGGGSGGWPGGSPGSGRSVGEVILIGNDGLSSPDLAGGGGGEAPRSSCGQLVDTILSINFVPSLLGAGRDLLGLAREYAKDPRGQNIPYESFQPFLTAGGQHGDVYKHILAHAGAWLIGESCILPGCAPYN